MVNRKRNYTLHFYLMAVLVTVALGAFNYLAMEFRARLDLTADQRFTLSEGTRRLFEKLTEPITVTYYVDEEPPAKRINLERDVRDKLEELAVSSGGKLQYRVERISNDQVAERRKELQDKGIESTVDVQTSGSDERAEVRGLQGYFSSLEIKYGTNEPKVINGVVNLVDKADEAREHRVDTLEFDIAYTVLTMRNETRRPGFERLIRRFDGQLQLALFVTRDMPDELAATKLKVEQGVDKTVKACGGRVQFVKREISHETLNALAQDNPFVEGDRRGVRIAPFAQGGRLMQVQTDQGVQLLPSEIYTACVYIRFNTGDGLRELVVGDFNDVPWRPAIRLLAEGGSLVHLQPEDPTTAYSFNWQGVSDWLDHAFVSQALAERHKPTLEIVHRNADLPASQAVSDHDPIVVVFDRSR